MNFKVSQRKESSLKFIISSIYSQLFYYFYFFGGRILFMVIKRLPMTSQNII